MNEAQLRDRIDELEEEVRQLRRQLLPVIALPTAWGLTRKEAQLLRALRAASPNIVGRERALLALYGFDDVPTDGVLNTFLSRLRRRLAESGVPVVIENRYGEGWRLSPESAHAFDEAVSQREAA